MDAKRCPVEKRVFAVWRDGNDPKPGVLLQKGIASPRELVLPLQCDDENIGLRALDFLPKIALVLQFPNHFYVGLIGDRFQNDLTHQARTVCNQYADGFHRGCPMFRTIIP